MKVCTDATLFGAMAPVAGGEWVLDIGAGNGLLALMLMQLGAGSAHAVEVSAAACADAAYNLAQSPWASDMQLTHDSIQAFAVHSERQYDLIISNPPFFERHSRSRARLRSLARHSDRLPHPELMHTAARLLASDGMLYLLVPRHAVVRLLALAREVGLSLVQSCHFSAFHGRPAKVVALTFRHHPRAFVERRLVIYNAPRDYSAESAGYLGPFLLRFAETTPSAAMAAPLS